MPSVISLCNLHHFSKRLICSLRNQHLSAATAITLKTIREFATWRSLSFLLMFKEWETRRSNVIAQGRPVVTKWPWHLLVQVRGLSSKRLRRARTETVEPHLRQVVPFGSDGEERKDDKSQRLIGEAAPIGAMWRETGRLSISCSHSAACPSVLSVCLPSLLYSPKSSCIYCRPFYSVMEPSCRIHIFYTFVCTSLTFDILLDRLAEWPRGFSFWNK